VPAHPADANSNVETARVTDRERNGACMHISGERGLAEIQKRRGYNRDALRMQVQFLLGRQGRFVAFFIFA
jgi:hypothetical protein